MRLDASERLIFGPGVRLKEDPVRETWVLLSPERAQLLDKSGLAILNALDGSRSLQEVAATLAARFKAPVEQVQADVLAFVTPLVERRILDRAA
ncbi:MAG: pyrroloquinoline quinone biosynthesis peptide chaperone PqqD [Pseudomonadota bacterium]